MKFLHIDPKTDNINLFDKYVSQGKHVFVLIYLEGCGPCIATRPEWKKLKMC
jgi:thiol-disulfide isomerase/thioredoxin